MTIWLAGLPWVAALAIALWVASLARRDASIVDPFWGPGFAMLAWVYVSSSATTTPRSVLVASLTTVWALRLFAHLAWRGRGAGEDYRYAAMRERWGRAFPVVSLGTVFLLQAGLMWLISAPLARVAAGHDTTWGVFDALGALLFVVGFLFEAVGDLQLARFKSDPANRGALLDRGLWRYTRHPNYFGDAVLWWGLACFALAVPGSPWVLVSPVVMTALLVKVSGVALLERRLVEAKPGYRDYVRRTSAFVPWPPRPARRVGGDDDGRL